MSTRQAADRRIRAASMAVPGLDVRGPVSQALARAGVAVPPASVSDERDAVGDAAPSPTSVAPARSRTKTAPRVTKPFADAPWPTQRARGSVAPRKLSGLTADERRVHRILLDTLAMQNDHGYGQGVIGLSYAEKQHLTVLDLGFIDAEIAKMDRGFALPPSATRLAFGIGGVMVALTAGLLVLIGEPEAALFTTVVSSVTLFLAVGLASLIGTGTEGQSRSWTPRRKIYSALRELALLADPDDVTSNALAQADAVIDRLATEPAPRLSLDDKVPSVAPDRTARRARS